MPLPWMLTSATLRLSSWSRKVLYGMSTTGLAAGRALVRLKTFQKVSVMARINHGLATKARQRGGRGVALGPALTGPLAAALKAGSGGLPPFRPLPARLNGMAACLGGIRPQSGSAVAIPGPGTQARYERSVMLASA